jgi:hypothetical protein
MPAQSTSWARESARLAYYSVAMGEQRDDMFLGLFEQANNALQAYLDAKQIKPPTLNRPPVAPSTPVHPSARRPLSILGFAAQPAGVAMRRTPTQSVAADPVSPQSSRSTRGYEPRWKPSAEAARQYCVAFGAVQTQLPKAGYNIHAAIYDVCSGHNAPDVASERGLELAELLRAMFQLKLMGPKAYLDQALSAVQASSATV